MLTIQRYRLRHIHFGAMTGIKTLNNQTIAAALMCLTLSACSSGLPDPAMLQTTLLGSSGNQQLTTGSTLPSERSVASHVLTAVAIERITGEAEQMFNLYN